MRFLTKAEDNLDPHNQNPKFVIFEIESKQAGELLAKQDLIEHELSKLRLPVNAGICIRVNGGFFISAAFVEDDEHGILDRTFALEGKEYARLKADFDDSDFHSVSYTDDACLELVPGSCFRLCSCDYDHPGELSFELPRSVLRKIYEEEFKTTTSTA